MGRSGGPSALSTLNFGVKPEHCKREASARAKLQSAAFLAYASGYYPSLPIPILSCDKALVHCVAPLAHDARDLGDM